MGTMRKSPSWSGNVEPGSALHGVSVHYLNTVFAEELQVAGFSRQSTIHDIEETVIRGRSADVVCPRDGRVGSAFVDAISGIEHTGRANYMLSYTWGYTVATIVDSLLGYCSKNGLNPKRTYVWICAFCINQHRVQESRKRGETVPFSVFSQEFSSRVKGIGHVLALMGPWQDPMYLERCWCIFELSIAVNIRCKCEIIMPPSEMDSFVGQLQKDGSGIASVWTVLHRVCIKRAKASVPDDYRNIMSFINEGPGLLNFNLQVRSKLETWFVSTAEESAMAFLSSGDSCSAACALVRVAGLLQDVGQHGRALALLRDVLQDLQERPACEGQAAQLAAQSRSLAILVAAKGTAERLCSQPEASLASLLRALHMREEQGTLETTMGAELLASLGATKAVGGDMEGALESFRRARRVHEAEGTLETAKGTGLLFDISLAEASLGQMDSAVETYESAQRFHAAAGLASMPSGLQLPIFCPGMNPCEVYTMSTQHVKMCATVCEYHREMGVLGTAYGAFALTVLAHLQATHGEFEAATMSCHEALAICESLKFPPVLFQTALVKTQAFIKRHFQEGDGNSTASREELSEKRMKRICPSLQASGQDFDLPFCHSLAARR